MALPVGTYGIAIQLRQTTQANLDLHPTWEGLDPTQNNLGNVVPVTAQDQFLRVFNQTITWDFLNVAGLSPSWPVFANLIRFTYQTAPSSAYFTPFGAGCYSKPLAWYEEFPVTTPSGSFDLSNLGIRCVPNGSSYLVSQGVATITPPLSTSLTTTTPALGTGDDGLYAAITLPWSFPYANGNTNQIMIGTNGIVFLSGTATTILATYRGAGPWLAYQPNIALAYGELDASGGSGPVGGIYYDVDPSNTKVYVTYVNVPEYAITPPATSYITAQLVLHSSGQIEMIYGSVTQAPTLFPIITGFTGGNITADPGSRNLANAGVVLPFTSGDGSVPAVLSMDARPILGTTPNLVTTGVKPTTQFAIMVFGFAAVTPGLDLAGSGMPGCFQYVQPAITNGAFFNSGVANSPLAIPNNPSLVGASIRAQSAPFQAGDNPAGILTSNALCIRVGT